MNMLGRLMERIRRHKLVGVRIFPNMGACLRLGRRTGETYENWIEAMRYQNM